MTKNDRAWEKILEQDPDIKHALEERAYFDITAKTIKDHSGREPRLACKNDFREQVPQPLQALHSSILALGNGNYRIARTDPFVSVVRPRNAKTQKHSLPKHIHALSPDDIKSESKALDAALISGILDDLTEDTLSLVLRGREYCSPFEFSLPDQQNPGHRIDYPVDGVQVEVDGGYEGKNGIYLIEAKIGTRDNMNLRQLLYPHLHYKNIYRKPVKSYLMFYQPTGQFHFYSFSPNHLQLDGGLGHWCYQLEHRYSDIPLWENIIATSVDMRKTDRSAPFPQADKFEVVVEVFLKLCEKKQLSKEALFVNHDIVPRQYDYYVNVLRWMRLIQKTSDPQQRIVFELSPLGNELAGKPVMKMLLEMARIVFSNSLLNLYLHHEQPRIPDRVREENGLRADSTFERRLQTVRSWVNYFRKIFVH